MKGRWYSVTRSRLAWAGAATCAVTAVFAARMCSQVPGDTPELLAHVDQAQIDSGQLGFDDIVEDGRFLFSAQFNALDGFGRPGATGNGVPSRRNPASAPMMTRVSGPEANSCAGCHNQPEAGGAGDFVANVFVMAQVLDPITDSVTAQFSDERNTLGMHGSGPIEMLAREMTVDLLNIRMSAIATARRNRRDITLPLVTKDVDFGSITAHPDGSVDTSKVEGCDKDLIIKPFHQKGVVASLRVFTVNAYNHHHGMEAVERFGEAQTGERDFDLDGVPDEMSVGDITAATIFQAALSTPVQVMPQGQAAQQEVRRGEQLFDQVGCASCHRPVMLLKSPIFSEPNPFNPPGNLRVKDVPHPFSFNMHTQGLGQRLETLADGRGVVRAYTDLKRHKIADSNDEFFANERLVQSGVPLDEFLTRKLWDCGSSGPWGHRGDCSSIGEAIEHHAGEARQSRDAFMALKAADQRVIINFLKTLQVIPENR